MFLQTAASLITTTLTQLEWLIFYHFNLDFSKNIASLESEFPSKAFEKKSYKTEL